MAGRTAEGADYLAILLKTPESGLLSRGSAERAEREGTSGSAEFRDMDSGHPGRRLVWRLDADQSRLTYSWHPIESRRRLGEVVASFSIRDLAGVPRSIDSTRGRVVVLNWWAVWCAPCVEEIPALNRLVADFAHEPEVEFVAISPDAPTTLTDFLRHTPFDYRQTLVDVGAREWLGESFPRHVVIDRTGRVTYDRGGGLSSEPPGLRAALRAALDGPAGAPGPG